MFKKNNPVVYAIDRSKAVGRVFVLIVCGLMVYTTGASCFKVFPCSLSSSFFILFSIVITSRGEWELVYVLLVHVFVCFVRVSFCHLPLGVWGRLRFLSVALPGRFY